MRINKYVAGASGLSRRAADQAVSEGRVTINGQPAEIGDDIGPGVIVRLDEQLLLPPAETTTIMLNKPVGYVCSRNGQGSSTVYDLLPPEYETLQTVGRLDKNSSGLLLLTNDGRLANELTHPSYVKEKIYAVTIDKPLTADHQKALGLGVQLEDGLSHLDVQLKQEDKATGVGRQLRVTMTEGRNRQIRRTFAALGYAVIELHRTGFGPYKLGGLPSGEIAVVKKPD